MYETMWHSVCHILSIDVFTVYALPSRLVVTAYAFLVLIISNTYTANLAAFLTVDQLDTSIKNVADLWGKRVATFPTYQSRLNKNHPITTVTSDGALSVHPHPPPPPPRGFFLSQERKMVGQLDNMIATVTVL
jgi:hypothetical protein